MQVYLIRHPEPRGAAGLCYGRRELPLDSPELTAALEKVRAALPAEVLAKAQIFSSPLLRCRQLADALSPQAAALSSELIEIDFGSWEGLPWNDVPRDELDAWAQDLWAYRPGGGESADMVAARWRRWREMRWQERSAVVIAITHAGVRRVARACQGGPALEELPASRIDFGTVHQLDLESHR
jgi:alpha-ribazole phosphatase